MTKSSQNERRYSAQFTLGYSHGLLIGIASFILWELTLSINSVGLVGNLFQSLFSREHVGTVTTTNQSDFEWANLPVLEDLQYAPCYDGLQCARLSLPLDWWNQTTSKAISLAILRIPAKVPITDARYGGPMLVNPGGPGGSGINFVKMTGRRLQDIIDNPNDPHQIVERGSAKYFDILTFDPRGVGASEPPMKCFSDPSVSQTWDLRVMSEGIINSSDASLGRLWSMTQALGASCTANSEEHDIKFYGSTASVARDMLEIVERHGKWRDFEARKTFHQGSCRVPVPEELPTQLQHLRYVPNEEKILYWGFSYGSFLGSTFAAMFPDRIERLILDGVVDAPDYLKMLWTDNLIDTEKDMQSFYDLCATAGHDKCALATKDSKPADIEAKVDGILEKLWHNPLPVTGEVPEVVSYSDVKNLLFASLYTPLDSFAYLANLLSEIERGDGTNFAKLLHPYHTYSCPSTAGKVDRSSKPLRNDSHSLYPHVVSAIACGDGDPQTDMSFGAFDAYWQHLQSLSPTIGPMWAEFRMACTAWTMRPLYRFTGPYEANTSHPILWIGNTADPVTPLRSAMKMSKGFPESVVLTQDSSGHCSTSSFSNCTTHAIRRYFQTGRLPPPGTICQVDETPFNKTSPIHGMDFEMRTRAIAHKEIRQAFQEEGLGFMRKFLNGRIPNAFPVY